VVDACCLHHRPGVERVIHPDAWGRRVRRQPFGHNQNEDHSEATEPEPERPPILFSVQASEAYVGVAWEFQVQSGMPPSCWCVQRMIGLGLAAHVRTVLVRCDQPMQEGVTAHAGGCDSVLANEGTFSRVLLTQGSRRWRGMVSGVVAPHPEWGGGRSRNSRIHAIGGAGKLSEMTVKTWQARRQEYWDRQTSGWLANPTQRPRRGSILS
jgi:hypothetical protein